jgi:hypothetical protein
VMLSGEPVRYSREDGGYTLRYHLADPKADRAFNIVLQSNEEGDKRKPPVHAKAREFAGKRLRVTIEVID